MPNKYHWKTKFATARHVIEEQRPYDECPHCSRYKLTTVRQKRGDGPGLIRQLLRGGDRTFTIVDEYQKCENCGYKDTYED